jgi:predicted  nucleic acid-binding Zn-ribbon protein
MLMTQLKDLNTRIKSLNRKIKSLNRKINGYAGEEERKADQHRADAQERLNTLTDGRDEVVAALACMARIDGSPSHVGNLRARHVEAIASLTAELNEYNFRITAEKSIIAKI